MYQRVTNMENKMLTPGMIAEIDAIKAKGVFTNDEVYVKAKDPRSELHNYPGYKWDQKEAAEAFNKQVSSQVISLYVQIVTMPDGKDVEIRGVISVKDPETGRRGYRDTLEVYKESPREVALRVCDLCEAHVNKYPIPEVEPIRLAIAEVRASVAPKRRRRGRQPKGPELRPRA
jgi:hypothetical protein